ncbi:SCO family protein [Coralloluteibacterium stylophorae]|uniref:SCO family protein n=1 Tax=Coralloluteibacterium stylophorae TaxID=1776034 RepID=A0A8J7VUB9_9GAMM|nr:SCO family protein [Coralloluteibacterium stylophorae]MBS7457621.1 SCO family protein [Coralloluteibacterium stylophorae]
MFNRTTLVVLAVALVAGLGLWFAQRHMGGAAAGAGPQLEVVRLLPDPRPLPDVALQRAGAAAVTPEALRGRWTLVFLGFTHCPDICPTTLADMARAQTQWRETLPEAQRPRLLFVSVDPERDTPERTAEYARYFDADTVAVTAEIPVLREFAQALGMVFVKAPGEGDDYGINHSSMIAVLDPQARFAGIVRPDIDEAGAVGFDAAAIARDMRTLAGGDAR